MSTPTPRVGYVLKMYPRFSETFVVSHWLYRPRSHIPFLLK